MTSQKQYQLKIADINISVASLDEKLNPIISIPLQHFVIKSVEKTTIIPITLVFLTTCRPYTVRSFILTKTTDIDKIGMITTASQNCFDFAITLINSKENNETPITENIST